MTGSGSITFADLQRAFQQMRDAPPPPPVQYVVHPLEAAWIKNPVGEPPSTHAVMVAMAVGSIQAGHPEYDSVMAALSGPHDNAVRTDGEDQ